MIKGDLVVRSYGAYCESPSDTEVGIITSFEIVEHNAHNFEAVCPTKYTKYAVVLWPDNYDTHELTRELTLASDYFEVRSEYEGW